jgi:flagellum-specific ATP synthase
VSALVETFSSETIAQVSRRLAEEDLARRGGRVRDLIGLIIETSGLSVEMGEICLVGEGRDGREGGRGPIPTEVVGFRGGRTLLMPLGELRGIGPGTLVRATGRPFEAPVGEGLLGRVIDGLGTPLDEYGDLVDAARRSAEAAPPDALSRPRISERIGLGVRALDTLVPCGVGQRLGIFAGSGVGKSSLLGMIARSTTADVNVIALVGERGREVREFIERDLGDALGHSVVIVATSDQPALVRIQAAFTATAIAEHFRDQGKNVMLMMDSVTRFAMAQREVGLAIGEPPATRGYTPSVFALLPRLLERAGTSPRGAITGLYTVLVDGDDMNEPIADAVRSILDGHIVLTRSLAHAGHYPAIDVLQSVSRLIGEICTSEVQSAGQRLRAALAAYREKEDLISIGAYQSGTDPLLDSAVALRPRIDAFLRQRVDDASTLAEADNALVALASEIRVPEIASVSAAPVDAGEGDATPAPAANGRPAIALAPPNDGPAIPGLSLA